MTLTESGNTKEQLKIQQYGGDNKKLQSNVQQFGRRAIVSREAEHESCSESQRIKMNCENDEECFRENRRSLGLFCPGITKPLCKLICDATPFPNLCMGTFKFASNSMHEVEEFTPDDIEKAYQSCANLGSSSSLMEVCSLTCLVKSTYSFCPDICEMQPYQSFCKKLCDEDPHYTFCSKICKCDPGQDFCYTKCDLNRNQTFCFDICARYEKVPSFCYDICQSNPDLEFCNPE